MSTRHEPKAERVKRLSARSAEIAKQMIQGDLGIIAGARLLSSLGHSMVNDSSVDEDFVVFTALDSETDHLPLEDQRSNWDPDAYSIKQLEVRKFEDAVRARIMTACRSIIARFGDV